MRAQLEFCSKRSVVAVLASGVIISMTALTGGMAPAFADPTTQPVVPTTTVGTPEPELVISEQTKTSEAETPETPPSVPVTLPTLEETVEAPPQTPAPQTHTSQTDEPQTPTQTVATTTAPVITSAAPAPRLVAPSTTEQAPATSAERSPVSAPPATPPTTPDTSSSETTTASSSPPSSALVAPALKPMSGSAATESEEDADSAAAQTPESSAVSRAARVIEQSQPQTLEAPEEDIQIAKSAKIVEVKPDPAPKQDVDALSGELNLDLNLGRRDSVNADTNAEVRLASARVWDRDVRRWSPDWVRYDEFYRPIILNPFRDPVRIVYVYENATADRVDPASGAGRPRGGRVRGVQLHRAVLATASGHRQRRRSRRRQRRGGHLLRRRLRPGVGLPLPPPPPPVLRYDNVPVLVRYSNATYEPFRVSRIVDVGDDVRFGERKVLLDGATPAWGVWTQIASGERQFEVHRTQQFPGLDAPQEASAAR